MIEILNDKAHLDYFRDFMVRRGCTQEDRPIEFWFAVEDLKGSVNEKKKHQSKLKKIKNRFLSVDAIKCKPLFYYFQQRRRIQQRLYSLWNLQNNSVSQA